MARIIQALSIFLASPGDVAPERKQAREVIDELNRTVAREKGVTLEVFGWETDAYPAFGADGQAIINDEIGKMEEHDLFVGILWNRFGTPTPRAGSGTEEEFDRAEASFRNSGRPQIMFYFCERPFSPRQRAELDQKAKVLDFQERVQASGLTGSYTETSEFRTIFQRHIMQWLAQQTATTPNPPQIHRMNFVEPQASSVAAATSPSKSESSPPSIPAGNPVVREVKVVGDSGIWLLLGENFYQTESVEEKNDGSVTLAIVPQDSEQDAHLRTLQANIQRRRGEALPFAYQNTAGIATISTADRHSVGYKNVWNVILKLEPTKSGYAVEYGLNNYSASQLATLRAEFILLNKLPDQSADNGSSRRFRPSTNDINDINVMMLRSTIMGRLGGTATQTEGNVLSSLWKRFDGRVGQFLPLARLWLVYHLLTSHTVDHVLDLKLGPLSGNLLHIEFRGIRQGQSGDVESGEVVVNGDCDLGATVKS